MERAGLIGVSTAMRTLKRSIEKMARSDASVLIIGETGSGKELAARSLHYAGRDSGAPFVPVNCAGLPPALVESELFGHVKGAFTGANRDHDGLVGAAQGGTLFLDEVDALAPRAQASLLRFLEDGTYRPVGANRERRAKLRIVTATNEDLEARIAQSAFRRDLYFRLSPLVLDVPPLRERGSDILLLAQMFLDRHQDGADGAMRFDRAQEAALLTYSWPGNVRELENTVLRALVLAERGRLSLPAAIGGAATPAASTDEPVFAGSMQAVCKRELRKIEKRYLRWLMQKSHGNISEAARFAQTDRRHIGRKLQELGIDRTSFDG